MRIAEIGSEYRTANHLRGLVVRLVIAQPNPGRRICRSRRHPPEIPFISEVYEKRSAWHAVFCARERLYYLMVLKSGVRQVLEPELYGYLALSTESQSQHRKTDATKLALLDEWARQFSTPLKRFFGKRIARPVEADDLVQEVFLRLSKRPNLAEIERIEGYIFQTASSVLTDHYRKGARTSGKHVPFDEEDHTKATASLERHVEARQRVQCVMDALHELPDVTRRIFTLYHLQNLRQKDIAKMLDMSLRKVEEHMSTASRHLYRKLGPKP